MVLFLHSGWPKIDKVCIEIVKLNSESKLAIVIKVNLGNLKKGSEWLISTGFVLQ